MTTRASQHGFAMVAAVFLLAVLATLGALMVQMGGTQRQTTVLAVQSARALQAAYSGAEWQAYRAVNAGDCTGATLQLGEAALVGFTVRVACTASTHTEGMDTIAVYHIDARASYGVYGEPDYVSRRVRLSVTDAG